MDIQLDNRLEELSQGDWDGRRLDETFTPAVVAEFVRDRAGFRAPGGENQHDVEARIFEFLKTLPMTGDKPLYVGTHATAIKLVVRNILGAASDITSKLAIENTSLTVLNRKGDTWRIKQINDHAHLR